MTYFEVKMQHDEDTLEAMAHMQYDLFCKSNRIVRSLLSVGFILLGVVNYEAWWGILVIAYGCYLTTSTYNKNLFHNITSHIDVLIITQKILNVNSFERFFEQMFVLFQIESVYRYMNEKKAPGWVLSIWMIFDLVYPRGVLPHGI